MAFGEPVTLPPRIRYIQEEAAKRGMVPAAEIRDGKVVAGLVPMAEAQANRAASKTVALKNGKVVTVAEPVVQRQEVFPVAASEVERIRAALPAQVRQTAMEKYQHLIGVLYRDAETQFKRDGKVAWPKSIENELAILGAAQGNTSIVAQVEALASRFIVKAARQQQAQDSRTVTRGWHGHVSA